MAGIGVLEGEREDRSRGLPWTQTFVEALPLAPAWGGVFLAAAHFSVGLLYLYLAGGPLRFQPDFVFALLVGYAPVASVYARRATLACLNDLRPALDVSDDRFAEIAGEVSRWDTAWARRVGLIAVAVTVPILMNEPGVVEVYPPGHPVFPWLMWINLAAIWLNTRTITQEILVSRRFARLGRDHVRVDVLDQGPLRPFARRGVQGALVPIVAISIFSLLFVSGNAGDAVPVTQVLVIVIAAVSLVIPLQGVHQRLADQKQRRLARLADAIREAEEPVLAARAGEAAGAASHLNALLALRAQVESAREWPWDVPTLVRFTLYVAIGVGSWLGGALVERVVDVVLD